MKIVKQKRYIYLLKKILRKILNMIDNNNNCNIKTNGELRFTRDIKKNYKTLTVFDIGANLGEYSSEFLDCSDVFVHLFEPQVKCFNALLDKFKNNNSFILNNFGVSSSNKEAILYSDVEGSGLASLYERNVDSFNVKMDKTEKVILKRMDEYINTKNISKINLVKIDVEGHEMEVLKGFGSYLDSNFIDYIQFEYGGANIDSHVNLADFYKLFSDGGFVMCKIKRNDLEVVKYDQILEDFSYQNWVAVSKNIVKLK